MACSIADAPQPGRPFHHFNNSTGEFPMFRSILITGIFVILSLRAAFALEIVSGTVVLMDRDRGWLEIQIQSTNGHPFYGPHPFPGHRPPIPFVVPVRFTPGRLPPCVGLGKTIYVWGVHETGPKSYFRASYFRGDFQGGDPTGVRRRIGKCGKDRRGKHDRGYYPDRQSCPSGPCRRYP